MAAKKYKLDTATYIIIANMIGTGVFASLFFQVDALPSGAALMLLWLAGGIVALSGGLCYAELSVLFPRSGGEYEYLTRIFHPALGFATGICTLVVGFAAPVAGSALNLGNYMAPILGIAEDSMAAKGIAILSVLMITDIQLLGVHAGARFQNISTIFKLLLIGVFIALPFVMPGHQPPPMSFELDKPSIDLVFSGEFFSALALLYFAYTGWNSSVYIASEVENPRRNLPLSILIGVITVTILYLLLNYAFLRTCSFEEIKAGGSSVGNTVIAKLFGDSTWAGVRVTHVFSMLMSLALLATLNGYMVTAPRVAEVLGKDYPVFKALTREWSNGAPYVAILVMGGVSAAFAAFSNMKAILDYVGYSLAIFASLAVAGVYIMRWRAPKADRPFKVWGYPITPLVFLGINTAMIYYSIGTLYGGNFWYGYDATGNIEISPLSASVLTILGSIGVYYIMKRMTNDE